MDDTGMNHSEPTRAEPPRVLLAGEEESRDEPHIQRGID